MHVVIHSQLCEWNEAAVGRIILSMKKYESGLWDNIIIAHVLSCCHVQKLKNTPKNIHKWWSMQEQLDEADREIEEAEQKKLDQQRMEAERIYWEEKKKKEEAQKAEQNASEEAAQSSEDQPAETPAPSVAPEAEQKEAEHAEEEL